jgi:hypothetical protein
MDVERRLLTGAGAVAAGGAFAAAASPAESSVRTCVPVSLGPVSLVNRVVAQR